MHKRLFKCRLHLPKISVKYDLTGSLNFLESKLERALFYFNCKHIISLYIAKQKQTKTFADFRKIKFLELQKILKIEFC